MNNRSKKIQNIYCDMFDKAEIEQYIRHCEEDKAVSYLFQVTAGLESMVLGEDQILGQVKMPWIFKNHGI